MLNISQFWRSLKTGALGIRLSRHGLATALIHGTEKKEIFTNGFINVQLKIDGLK